MSLINILTRTAPTLSGYEFDAVLEDTLEIDVTLTEYPIELGARVSDHRIINPYRWSLTGAISNNPLKTSVTDFVGAATNIPALSGGIAGTVAGLTAGFLGGGNETRASATLDFLIDLMTTGEPFEVDAGDIQLTNMVIGNLIRTKDASNEGGLVFTAQLQELPTLETVLRNNQPQIGQLRDGDPALSQASALVNKGELAGSVPGASTLTAATGLL